MVCDPHTMFFNGLVNSGIVLMLTSGLLYMLCCERSKNKREQKFETIIDKKDKVVDVYVKNNSIKNVEFKNDSFSSVPSGCSSVTAYMVQKIEANETVKVMQYNFEDEVSAQNFNSIFTICPE